MSSQHYVDEANKLLDASAFHDDGAYVVGQAQVNATLAVAASIHDVISHLRGMTPSRPFDGSGPALQLCHLVERLLGHEWANVAADDVAQARALVAAIRASVVE